MTFYNWGEGGGGGQHFKNLMPCKLLYLKRMQIKTLENLDMQLSRILATPSLGLK